MHGVRHKNTYNKFINVRFVSLRMNDELKILRKRSGSVRKLAAVDVRFVLPANWLFGGSAS